MIQVCSRCGTRWNVRDRQRVWCPRCQGSLLAPSANAAAQLATQQQWAAAPTGAASQPAGAGPGRRLPTGYRWIAVRPGAAPPPRRTRRPLGPTPRYAVAPRWGLQDQFDAPVAPPAVERSATSARFVRGTATTTLVLLALAGLIHLLQYVLLLVNRSTLLNPIVAGVATWAGVAIDVAAFVAMLVTLVVLTTWLIRRRAAAYDSHGADDPRPTWELWLGCLVPVANLLWAPVFVLELASVEGRLSWLRSTIVVWWCVWWVSFAVSVFSLATSFTTDAQGVANNTMATIVAYLVALTALLLTLRVHRGFDERAAAAADDRPVRRWVVVPDADAQSPTPVESERDDPAA